MKVTAVVVAKTAKMKHKLEMASHVCQHCRKQTVVQASMAQPFCVHCGSENTRPRDHAGLSQAGNELLKAKDNELASIKCPGCSSHIFMTEMAAASHHTGDGIGHINCAACGQDVAFEVDDDLKSLIAEQEQSSDDNTVEDDSWDSDEVEDNVDDETAKTRGAKKQKKSKSKKVTAASATQRNVHEDIAEEEEEEDDAKGDDTEQDIVDPNAATNASVTLSLASIVSGQPTFVCVGDKAHCIVGDNIVATGNADEALCKALNEACAANPELNLVDTLNSNGFKLNTVSVPISAAVQQAVDEQTAAAREELAAKTENMRDAIKQSLGIALAAMSRNVFSESNPLIDVITAALTDNDVGADVIENVTQALVDGSDDIAEVVQDQVMDLLDKSEDSRNETASLVLRVAKRKPMEVATTKVNTLGKRLSQGVTPSAETAAHKEEAASKHHSRVSELAGKSALFAHGRK